MRKLLRSFFTALVVFVFSILPAQASDFFVGFTSQGSNFWFTPMQIPVALLNSVIGGGSSGLTYDWVNFSSDDNRKITVDNGKFFGFKAKDMFNNFGIGAQVTYQPQYSIFGMWVKGGYKYRQFRADIDPTLDYLQKYKVNAWNVGVGIRLTPFRSMLENHNWSPFVDFGTTYNDVFNVKAPYDNDKSQFGNGMATSYGIGARIIDDYEERSYNIMLSVSLPHYDYLRRDFKLADGTMPYEHIKSKNYSISLSFQLEF